MATAAITIMRQAIMGAITAEFAADGIAVHSDKLHDSLGDEGPVAGVYPDREAPGTAGIDSDMVIMVQVFRTYVRDIDPRQQVDPAEIEEWAWRLQRRFRDESTVNDPKAWWWNVRDIDYPDDPTGNKSRFVMTLVGYGPNATIVETTA